MSNLINNFSITYYLLKLSEDFYNPEFLENLKRIVENEEIKINKNELDE